MVEGKERNARSVPRQEEFVKHAKKDMDFQMTQDHVTIATNTQTHGAMEQCRAPRAIYQQTA